MNIREYISSGIIESYVLGLASAEERAAFEQLCSQYPELVQARTDFETALEKKAQEFSITPGAGLKEKIINSLQNIETGKIVPFGEKKNNRQNWLRYGIAASIILLAGSLYWNISLYNKNKKLNADLSAYTATLDTMHHDMDMMLGDHSNSNIKMAALKGMPDAPGAMATVYWDTVSHDVYLLINNLPHPPSDKQYQLWALLDKKPIDLGVINNNYFIRQNSLLLKAKNAQQAQAFAITLEDMGGHPEPKGKMYVMGNL
jgi:anti-sigma-K factor RskA